MIWAGITLVVSTLFDWAIVGTAVAFLCSKPKEIVSVKRLATISLIVFVLQDILDCVWVTFLGLTIITNNETLIRLIGRNELVHSYTPSLFSTEDVLIYAIQVAVAVLCGRLLIGRYRKKYSMEEIS